MIIRGTETLLVQGITGKQGTFWAGKMRDYGTRVVGGVNPRKAGTEHLSMPVWGSAVEAARSTQIDASVLFIPPLGVKDAVLDAISAGIEKIVVLTEHVPVQDVMHFLSVAREVGVKVAGPNTAGHVTPGENFVGFMPAFNDRVFRPGNIGVVSRSGSLGTLMCLTLVEAGFGISAFVGIGGDPVVGTTLTDALESFDQDERTEAVVIVGEIGGGLEEAAAHTASSLTMPIVSFIAGAASPPGKKMGHAGAIVMGNKGSYAGKKAALESGGIEVAPTPSHIPRLLAARLP